MTADIRTAAEREAERAFDDGADDMSGCCPDVQYGFERGAVWAAARVIPTREQVAEVCEGYLAARFTDPLHPQLEFVTEDSYGCADAVLALMAGLAEGEGRHEGSSSE